ncbi:hypothetical protein NXC12_PD00303 (plasmid) [Rhizobium etli]|uniref:Uncharacterized protein n=1 Tax=Rhizobium etli TaxID=29449 RepID=A0AAN1BN43_RHIET|nr:hypothetical protein NXC12_PD00303 [Rhizobium etli]
MKRCHAVRAPSPTEDPRCCALSKTNTAKKVRDQRAMPTGCGGFTDYAIEMARAQYDSTQGAQMSESWAIDL